MSHQSTEIAEASADRLAPRVAELEETNRLKDEFLAKLGHELGNMFLPYQFVLQVLQQPNVDRPTLDRVRRMLEDHATHVDQFLDDVRYISRIARGKLQIDPQEMDLKQVVQQAVGKVRALVEKNQQQLSLSIPADDTRVIGDAPALEHMLGHLLRNAVRFTEPGGKIDVRLQREGGEHVVHVCDTGMGMPPDLLPRLFRLFAQADPLTGGWGAGLAIVRSVAELHGGRVEASSPGPGKGSQFVVRLPAA